VYYAMINYLYSIILSYFSSLQDLPGNNSWDTLPGILRSEESLVYNKVGWELSKLCSCTASLNLTRIVGDAWGRTEEGTLFCQDLILNGESGLVIRRDYQINIQTTTMPNSRIYFCVV